MGSDVDGMTGRLLLMGSSSGELRSDESLEGFGSAFRFFASGDEGGGEAGPSFGLTSRGEALT